MLRRTAGLAHIVSFIAGANMTGARAERSTVLAISSAMPSAAFAMMSAVAGATTTRSAHFESSTCSTTGRSRRANMFE